MFRKLFAGIFAAGFLLCHQPTAVAQERARIAWAAFSSSHIPLWVAQEKGLFQKHGIAPEVIFFSNGPTALQALVAGELDIVLTSAPNVVNPRLAGMDTVMILSLIPTFTDHIVAVATIPSPDHLKGKIFRISHMGYCDKFDVIIAIAATEMVLKGMGYNGELGSGLRKAEEPFIKS